MRLSRMRGKATFAGFVADLERTHEEWQPEKKLNRKIYK
jgi:hypothetical protein